MSDQDNLDSGSREAQAANLFDLRRIIGGLFGIYGVILVVVGIGDGSKEIARAAGVHVNLVAGIGMLVLSAIFWIWALTRPLAEQLGERD